MATSKLTINNFNCHLSFDKVGTGFHCKINADMLKHFNILKLLDQNVNSPIMTEKAIVMERTESSKSLILNQSYHLKYLISSEIFSSPPPFLTVNH